MKPLRLAGLVILSLGILALVYGGFSYTRQTHEADLGPLEIRVKDKERVDVPVWAGVAAAVTGAGLLVVGGRRPAA